jgi:hypothetical protein
MYQVFISAATAAFSGKRILVRCQKEKSLRKMLFDHVSVLAIEL